MRLLLYTLPTSYCSRKVGETTGSTFSTVRFSLRAWYRSSRVSRVASSWPLWTIQWMVTGVSRLPTMLSVWSEMEKSWLEVVSNWVHWAGSARTSALAATMMAMTMAAAATL